MARPVDMLRQNRIRIVCACLLTAYAAFRLLALPAEPQYARGFSHDSAYLTVVARNLLAGKGFVLDALWLVFLQPAQLPMPYHNANPLFPVMVAGWTGLFGTDVFLSGFALSALASAGLIVALTMLVKRYLPRLEVAFGIAFLTALFPEVWASSWKNLTDELWVAFVIAFIAALVRSDRPGMAMLAGVFWGLAWLTRSLAVLLIPATAMWMWRTHGWRKAITRGALVGSAALAVCTPWLLHTAKTWGSPLRSDNDYLMSIQAYTADLYNGAVERAWHSPATPAPFGQIVIEHTGAVTRRWLRGLVPFAKTVVRGGAAGSYPAAALLAILAAAIALQNRRSLATPGALGFLVYVATLVVLLAFSGTWMESRYFIAAYVVFSAWLIWGIFEAFRTFLENRRNFFSAGIAAAAASCFVFFFVPADLAIAREQRSPDLKENVPYMRVARLVNENIAHGGPVVVGHHPYLYSVATGAQALSIPESDDEYLLSYMRKYRARHVLLSEEELAFWRPAWTSSGGLPKNISLRQRLDGYSVFEVAR